ncbi:MAG: Rv3235 family protein [Propionibacteriaceae bacterium]|jgi:hypothetical protein|nr:Rv3235 family protein [Propionibacteriaceae bacterium]
MDLTQARASRPTGRWPRPARLFEPASPGPSLQPALPWDDEPDVAACEDGVSGQTKHLAQAMTAAIVEGITGRRPLHQLERLCGPTAMGALEPLRRHREASGLRLHSIRVRQPRDDVLEVAAHLRRGRESRAAAVRLQRTHKGWRCTRFEAVLTPRRAGRGSS